MSTDACQKLGIRFISVHVMISFGIFPMGSHEPTRPDYSASVEIGRRDCRMPVSPFSISDWQKIAVIDHHNHQIILDPLHTVADTASSFIPEFCICSSINAVTDILQNQSRTRRQLADMACAEVIADARARLNHPADIAMQSSVLETHVTKLVADKATTISHYDRGTPDVGHELIRIRSLLENYPCEDTYYFSEVFVESSAQNVTVSVAANLSCSEFLPPLVVTNKITHQFGYHPNACIDSLYMSLYLERINILMRHSNRNIVIVMHNHLLVDDRKLSNIKLHYINPLVDRYCDGRIDPFDALRFPDDYGLNYWLASTLQIRLISATKYQNSNLAVSAVLQLYNETIEKLLRTSDFVYFNLISVAQSKFTGEVCGELFSNKSFELVDGLILARDRTPLAVPDMAKIGQRAASRYFPSPQEIQNIVVDLKAFHFSPLDTTASLSCTWELVLDTLYPFILANDSDELLGKFHTFLLSFADKYANRRNDSVPPSTVTSIDSLAEVGSNTHLVASDLNLPVPQSALTRPESPAKKAPSTSHRKMPLHTLPTSASRGESSPRRADPKSPPKLLDVDSEYDSEAAEASRKLARYEIIGDVVLTNVIELRSRSRALRPRKRSASQNMVKNIKKSKIIEAFEKNHLSFVTSSDSRFFSDNSDESSDESFDHQITSSGEVPRKNSSTRADGSAEISARKTNGSHLESLRSIQSINDRRNASSVYVNAPETPSIFRTANLRDFTVVEAKLTRHRNQSDGRNGERALDSSDVRSLPLTHASVGTTNQTSIHPAHNLVDLAVLLGYTADTSLIVPEVDMTALKAASRRNPQLNLQAGSIVDSAKSLASSITKTSERGATKDPNTVRFLNFTALDKATMTKLDQVVQKRMSASERDLSLTRSASAKTPATTSDTKGKHSGSNLQSQQDTEVARPLTLGSRHGAQPASSKTNVNLDPRLTEVNFTKIASRDTLPQIPDALRGRASVGPAEDRDREVFLKESATRLDLKLAPFRSQKLAPVLNKMTAHSIHSLPTGDTPDTLLANDTASVQKSVNQSMISNSTKHDEHAHLHIEGSGVQAESSVNTLDGKSNLNRQPNKVQEEFAPKNVPKSSVETHERSNSTKHESALGIAEENHGTEGPFQPPAIGTTTDELVSAERDVEFTQPQDKSTSDGNATKKAAIQTASIAFNEPPAIEVGGDVEMSDGNKLLQPAGRIIDTIPQKSGKCDMLLGEANDDEDLLDADKDSESRPSVISANQLQITTALANGVSNNEDQEMNDSAVDHQLVVMGQISPLRKSGKRMAASIDEMPVSNVNRELREISKMSLVNESEEANDPLHQNEFISSGEKEAMQEAIPQQSRIEREDHSIIVEEKDRVMHDAYGQHNYDESMTGDSPQHPLSIGGEPLTPGHEPVPPVIRGNYPTPIDQNFVDKSPSYDESPSSNEPSQIIEGKADIHKVGEEFGKSKVGEASSNNAFFSDGASAPKLVAEADSLGGDDISPPAKAVSSAASSTASSVDEKKSSQGDQTETVGDESATSRDSRKPLSPGSDSKNSNSSSSLASSSPSLSASVPVSVAPSPLVPHALLLLTSLLSLLSTKPSPSSQSTSSGFKSPQAASIGETPATPFTEHGRGKVGEETITSLSLIEERDIDYLIEIDADIVAKIAQRMPESVKAGLAGKSLLEREKFLALKIAGRATSDPSRYQQVIKLPMVRNLVSKYYYTMPSPSGVPSVLNSLSGSEKKTVLQDEFSVATLENNVIVLSGAEDIDMDIDSTFLKTPSQRRKKSNAAPSKKSLAKISSFTTDSKNVPVFRKGGLATLSSVRPIESSSFLTTPLDNIISNKKGISSFFDDLDPDDSKVSSDSDSDEPVKVCTVASVTSTSSVIKPQSGSKVALDVRKSATKPKPPHEKKERKARGVQAGESNTVRGLPSLSDIAPPSSEPIILNRAKSRNILAKLVESDSDSKLDDSDDAIETLGAEKILLNTLPQALPQSTIPFTPTGASSRYEHATPEATRSGSSQPSKKERQSSFFQSVMRGSAKLAKIAHDDAVAPRDRSKFRPKTSSIAKPYLIHNGTKPTRDTQISQPAARTANPSPSPALTIKTEPEKKKVYSFIDKLTEIESSSDSDLA